MQAHERLFGVEVLFRVAVQKGDGILDAMLSLAIEYLIVESMGSLEERLMLLVDLGYPEAVGVGPGFQHGSPRV
jgi:hypothetical protein